MILLAVAAVVLCAAALLAAVVWRGWPSITFGGLAEQDERESATGIVIDPHRWDDPTDEWDWPDEDSTQ